MSREAVMEGRTDVVAERLMKAAKGTAPAATVPVVDAPPAPVERSLASVPTMPRRKFTTEIPPEGYKALRLAAVMDDVTISDIVSALVSLWSDDPELAERVRAGVQAARR
jgi:hypothetical protein